jgi:C-terminal processing protease CtpA/Prc
MVLIRIFIAGVLVLVSVGATAQGGRLDRDLYRNMLNVVAKDVEKNFYDPGLKGLDWKKLTEQARQKIDEANSNSAMITAIFSLVDKVQDSHTKFSPPNRAARPVFGFEAKAFGDDIRIFRIKARGAAEQAGLQVGDRILEINGFGAERNSFDLMMLYFRALRPVPAMKITYQRGTAEPQSMVLQAKVRKEERVKDLTEYANLWFWLYEDEEPRVDHYMMLEDGIGYAEVTDFDTERVTVVDLLEKPKAVVVDLRGNPGGILDSVLELAGHFEPEETSMGDVVQRKKTEPLKIKPHRPHVAGPMVLLVDSRSASGAEMFARHFQRTGRAVVVGDQTSGRVNVSRYYGEDLGNDRAGAGLVLFGVQIAVGKVVFPGGEELEHHGVTPDVRCVPADSDLHDHHDPCLLKAVSVARQKLGEPSELSPELARKLDGFSAGITAEKQKQIDSRRD